MKAGDVSGGQAFSRGSWLSTPLSDPNAALWASITPPANPNLATIRFPAHVSSRSTARATIVAAAVVFGAALGAAGFLVFGPKRLPGTTSVAIGTAHSAPASTQTETALRRGTTELAALAASPAVPSPTLANTVRSDAPTESVLSRMPSVDAAEPGATPTKAKRVVSKKRSKATARRANKRRARRALD